jgi:hypothetical protein
MRNTFSKLNSFYSNIDKPEQKKILKTKSKIECLEPEEVKLQFSQNSTQYLKQPIPQNDPKNYE